MKKILEFLKAQEIMCEIYENISESDKFYVGIIKSFELELLNDYSRALVGYIEKIDDETLSVKLINEHGIRDGVGIVKINDISCVAFDTEELQNLKILTDFRSKNCNGISYENF